jgi:hypothetical protein
MVGLGNRKTSNIKPQNACLVKTGKGIFKFYIWSFAVLRFL